MKSLIVCALLVVASQNVLAQEGGACATYYADCHDNQKLVAGKGLWKCVIGEAAKKKDSACIAEIKSHKGRFKGGMGAGGAPAGAPPAAAAPGTTQD